MATVTGPLSAGTLVKAATHASASSQYGKSITSGTKGTAASGWVWDTANIATGKLINHTNLKQQTTSHKIKVSWTAPQKGVIISCTGCATATNSSAYTGSLTFTCTSAGTKTVTLALSGGSSLNCGVWTSTTSVSVTAGSTGTTNVALKMPLYYTHGATARTLTKVSAAPAYVSQCSISYPSGAVLFTNMPYAVHSGFGPSTALYTGQYSKIYAACVVSAISVLNSNLASDGLPWVNDTYSTTMAANSSGTRNCTKPTNTAHYVCLSTALASATIRVTDWYAN